MNDAPGLTPPPTPPPAPPERIPAEEYARRLRALLGPGGLSVGFPRKRRDLMIILQAIAQRFAPDERLGEIEATQRIGGFLMEHAPGWKMDRATLRRALVDEGFLDRESGGTDYRRSVRHRRRVVFEDLTESG